MRTSETQSILVAALFSARQEFPVITKEKNGQAGNRTFKYAPLEVIKDAIEPVLVKHGLMITQPPEGHSVITRLEHISGEWREGNMPMNIEHANMQSYGIEATYRRRYSYCMMLGIVTEEDTDGTGGRDRKKGVDFTKEKNPNGTEKLPQGWSDSPGKLAFGALQPAIQDNFRQVAPQVDQAMPNVVRAIEIMEIAMDSWPDEDRQELKKGLWYLLDSKTRTSISKEQKK